MINLPQLFSRLRSILPLKPVMLLTSSAMKLLTKTPCQPDLLPSVPGSPKCNSDSCTLFALDQFIFDNFNSLADLKMRMTHLKRFQLTR